MRIASLGKRPRAVSDYGTRQSILAGAVGIRLIGALLVAHVAFAASTTVVLSVKTGRVVRRSGPEVAARPGSVIKPFVLAALREHGATPGAMACPGRLRIGGRQLDCTHPALNEPLDAHRALVYSCNNWFAAASRRLSAEDLRQTLLRFGLGPVEAARDDDSKRLEALGEAGLRVTPLQLAQAYRNLALAGDWIADLTAAASFGTAQLAAPFGGVVAAKTGTTAEGAWLAGWIPAEKPDYVVVTYVPAGSGGSDAAPVARMAFAGLLPKDPHGVRVQYMGKVLDLPLEEYIAGVVAGEAGTMRSSESLKAMAVTARTWASALRGRHRGFDFCSLTHCQEYRPLELSQAVTAAVRETAGELVWWQGRPASTYYSRDCGGVTEAGWAVWPELRLPYLVSQQDPWCRSRGKNEWRAEIPHVRVLSRTASGRVARVEVDGAAMTGPEFRMMVGRRIGWNVVRSDAFEVSGDVLRGTGSGHGVGLCQTGAAHMGEQGRGYREILAFYYPGTRVSRTAQGLEWQSINGERVRIRTTQPERDASMMRTADRLAGELERRIGLHFRQRPEVEVYPSVAAFRDGAGEPGWVAGSTQGRVIRLQPGMPESVWRHELLHELVLQNAATGLPLWFQEELVSYLAPGLRDLTPRHRDSAAGRVQQVVKARGEAVVLGWITTGLPSGLIGPTAPRR